MKGFVTLAAILAVGIGGILYVFTDGFAHNAAKGKTPEEEDVREEKEMVPIDEDSGGKPQFGSDRVPAGQNVKPVPFDGKRAMKYLQAIGDIGPRMSGTREMKKQQELIQK